jgi:hypothetical protein
VRWCDEDRIGLKFVDAFDLKKIGRAKSPGAPGLRMMRPAYLETESSPSSPWAGRQERLSIRDIRR